MPRVRSLAQDLSRIERHKQSQQSAAAPSSHRHRSCGVEDSTGETSTCSSSSSGAEEAECRSVSTVASSSSDERPAGRDGSRFDLLAGSGGGGGNSGSSGGDSHGYNKAMLRKAAQVCRNGGSKAVKRSHEEQQLANELRREREDGAGVGVGGVVGSPARISTPPPFKRLQQQPFSHILVCDFEATCDGGEVHYPHEIIEFPVVVLDTATLRVVATFHRYVRPLRKPKLTSFCTELTGITQEMVDAADPLPVVVEAFQTWLEDTVYPLCQAWLDKYRTPEETRELLDKPEGDTVLCGRLSKNLKSEQRHFTYDTRSETSQNNVKYEKMLCFATDGPWDMRRFMHECGVLRDKVDFPPLCYRYINVRHAYTSFLKCKQVQITHMLSKLHMSFEGQRHSGIDDTKNILRVLAELMARGYRVHHVSVIKYSHRGDAHLVANQAAMEVLAEYGEDDKPHTRRGGKGRGSAPTGGSCGSKKGGNRRKHK